jgi:lantibiotic modifying enzyme
MSGIAMGLARAAWATGDDRFASGARALCAAEDALLSEDGDLPLPGGRAASGDGWCQGRAGMVVARLEVARCLDAGAGFAGPALAPGVADLLAAMAARTGAAEHWDSLCCGSAGSIDVLVEAARRQDRRDLLRNARRRLASLADRQSDPVTMSFAAGAVPPAASAALFHGFSGVLHAGLRVLDPTVDALLSFRP